LDAAEVGLRAQGRRVLRERKRRGERTRELRLQLAQARAEIEAQCFAHGARQLVTLERSREAEERLIGLDGGLQGGGLDDVVADPLCSCGRGASSGRAPAFSTTTRLSSFARMVHGSVTLGATTRASCFSRPPANMLGPASMPRTSSEKHALASPSGRNIGSASFSCSFTSVGARSRFKVSSCLFSASSMPLTRPPPHSANCTRRS